MNNRYGIFQRLLGSITFSRSPWVYPVHYPTTVTRPCQLLHYHHHNPPFFSILYIPRPAAVAVFERTMDDHLIPPRLALRLAPMSAPACHRSSTFSVLDDRPSSSSAPCNRGKFVDQSPRHHFHNKWESRRPTLIWG